MPTVLVADDNPLTLRFFAEALTQLGLDCELANDGVEAVQRAERASFDLVLLDARMPGLDGAQALGRIRAGSPPSNRAIALATTADASEQARRELIAAGFLDVVTKPVSVESLRVLLAKHLPALSVDAGAGVERPDRDRLDHERALAAVGGDASILAALRGLLIAELDALPSEIATMMTHEDLAAMRDRLHRLDASAGFCGVPALAQAGARLRVAIEHSDGWPARGAVDEFLSAVSAIRARLAASRATDV